MIKKSTCCLCRPILSQTKEIFRIIKFKNLKGRTMRPKERLIFSQATQLSRLNSIQSLLEEHLQPAPSCPFNCQDSVHSVYSLGRSNIIHWHFPIDSCVCFASFPIVYSKNYEEFVGKKRDTTVEVVLSKKSETTPRANTYFRFYCNVIILIFDPFSRSFFDNSRQWRLVCSEKAMLCKFLMSDCTQRTL